MKIKKLEEKIIYQIFPRSFYDANNDGSGDLKGIIKKIGYLKNLGINAIWLCPIYKTSFADAGYDVKDYKAIWSQFGTLDDFKELAKIAKQNGIDIIMDIVLNHVSNEHTWFQKACQSAKSKEHNYFIWRHKLSSDEKKAKSIFGGSAWEYVASVKKYYFHLFTKEQVDLNWEHKATIAAMTDVINFWYQLGVKGFRLDAIKHIHKSFPAGLNNFHSWGQKSVPLLQAFIQKAFFNKKDAYLLGEASGITIKEALKYGKGKQKVATNFFNFSWWHIGWGQKTGRNGYDPNWNYQDFVKLMKPFQESPDVPPQLMTNFLSNHDTSRAISRWGDENIFWKEAAKSLALMLFTLKGIPAIYYGEEIGMLNPVFKNRKEFRDVDAINAYQILVDKKQIYSEDEMTKYHNINGRDNCRTPMQWNSNKNAGFNKGTKPWIKIGKSYKDINVQSQLNDPHSIFNFYKKIIALRKGGLYQKILVYGDSQFELLNNGIFKSTRTNNKMQIITYINLQNVTKKIKLPQLKVLVQSWSDNKPLGQELRPYESIMFFKQGDTYE